MNRLNGKIAVVAGAVASVVLLLASRDAQFATGTSLTADGGAINDRARCP